MEILLPEEFGWLNLECVKRSEFYPDFLEIYANSALHGPFVISPNYLFLAMFEDHPIYILEAKNIPKLHKDNQFDEDFFEWMQPLTQLSPYNFTYEQCGKHNDYNGKDIPNNSFVFSFINNGKFLLHPIDNTSNNTQIVESIWRKNKEEFEIKYPFYSTEKISDSEKFIFHEVTKFKSKSELLKQDQVEDIEKLILFIFENRNEEDRIKKEQIIDYCNQSQNPDFLLNYIEAARELSLYETVFYPKLSDMLITANNSKDNYHLFNHPEHSGFHIINQLYCFIDRYTEGTCININQYNEIKKQEIIYNQKAHEKLEKVIQKFTNRNKK